MGRATVLPVLLAGLLSAAASPVHAEMVVVMRADAPVQQLSQDEVINIFLGRYRRLPNGEAAIPMDQPEGSVPRAVFYRGLVNKGLDEIGAYWARLVFTGKTSPPRTVASQAELESRLLQSPRVLGYMDRAHVDSRFRVVLSLQP